MNGSANSWPSRLSPRSRTSSSRIDPEHWACLLRHSGDPVWVRLPGSGTDGAWTKDEQGLAQRLRAELNPETTKGNVLPLAEALARQRLEPLK
jgi:hypothetical protein